MARTRSLTYDDKRQSILDRSAELFARQGFPRTSIVEIAQACNSSKALLYHYYESKEAVLYDILENHIRLLIDVARGALEQDGTPREKLHALVHALMDVYVVARDKHIVLLNELGMLPAQQQKHIIALENEVVDSFVQVVEGLRPELAENPHLRKAVAFALLGMMNWTYTWFRAGRPLSAADFAELATDLFLNGVAKFRVDRFAAESRSSKKAPVRRGKRPRSAHA